MQRYIVLFSGAAMQLFLGILYLWGVFVKPASLHFRWEISEVKLTASFLLSFFVLGILLAGRLQLRYTAQLVTLFGGLLLASGMFISAFVPVGYGYVLYLTYGILGGLGVGVAYNAIISTAQKWFPENRGFATGVSVSAFGFSTVIFAPLTEYLVARYGLTNTFLILSVTFFVATMSLFRFIKMPDANNLTSDLMPQKKQASQSVPSCEYTTIQMLQTGTFYLLTTSLMFAVPVFMILNPSIKTLALERGLSQQGGVLLLMLIGVASALGRLIIPLASDKFGRELIALCSIAGTAVLAVFLCIAQGELLMVVAFAIAFFYGGFSGIYPVLTGGYFGMKYFGSNYGTVMLGFAASALTLPFMLHGIKSDSIKFLILAVLAAGATVAMGFLYIKRNKNTSH